MTERDAFYQTLASIPIGHYSSYGKLAARCGVHVRQVQAWLRQLPENTALPWYRIINSQRRISEHPGAVKQHQLLANEGLLPDNSGRFPLDRYWA